MWVPVLVEGIPLGAPGAPADVSAKAAGDGTDALATALMQETS